MFLSLPLDDWDKPSEGPAVVRTVGTRIAPDPARLDEFAGALRHASSPVVIYGAAIARGDGWGEATALAEALNAPVWAAPASERTPFPEDHPLYRGELPFAMGPLGHKLEGHDLALVVGAPVFRYYPFVPGPYVPSGMRLLHISDDPGETGRAPIGDSLLGDAVLSLAALTDRLAGRPRSNGKAPARVEAAAPRTTNRPADGLAATEVFAALNSFQYSVQSIWSAAQLKLPMLILLMRNGQYTILKSFAALEQTPGVPGLDLPGMDLVSIARGYGCDAARIDDLDALKRAAANAWANDVPTVVEVPVSGDVPRLV